MFHFNYEAMKKLLQFLIMILCLSNNVWAQEVNGKIMSTHHNLTVVKVWGSHAERGYAAGYLLADKFADAYENYISLAFGEYLPLAKMLIQHPYFFTIDAEYLAEAEAFIQGVHAAGYGHQLDMGDVLVGNCFLDLKGVFAGMQEEVQTGCSSLMSWGEATRKTDLNGKSIITRQLDWDIVPVLIRNQVMVIHIPAEMDEQPWLLIGFAGQISVMSGINQSGLAIMHQSMNDYETPARLFRAYEPATFAMRRAIERKDLNGDGVNSVMDIKAALMVNPFGFANNYIITGLAPSTAGSDEHIAIVAEVANSEPYYSIRHNTYPDQIPGQNLYAANARISFQDVLGFCDRYNNVVEQLGDGTRISSRRAWDIMKYHSVLPTRNLQFIQFIPELFSLKVGVHQMDGTIASHAHVLRFNTKHLFTLPHNLKEGVAAENPLMTHQEKLLVYPNPAIDIMQVSFPLNRSGLVTTFIYNILGEVVYQHSHMGQESIIHSVIDVSGLQQGTYFLRIHCPGEVFTKKINVMK
jgi:hypothetical protein